MKTISWFSAGVSSAVATKLVIDQVDEIIYTHIEDQHPDTLRFVRDCEAWFGKPVTIILSPYKTVEAAVLGAGGKGYINGPAGAACTRRLKIRVRKDWEATQTEQLRYVWGMDFSESDRAESLVQAIPDHEHMFPLIERKMSKVMTHEILKASGIKRPVMYDLGYPNNNCIGCVKGGQGYWNKIRQDFPEVFDARAKLERSVGASCINGMYLDKLNPARGRKLKIILDNCGIMCELMRVG